MVYKRLLGIGPREDRAIAYLMAACFLIFVAQWPRLVRLSQGTDLPVGTPLPELDRLMAYEFMGWVMIWPLGFYVLGGLGYAGLRFIGIRFRRVEVSGYDARLALFWALLAATPAMLLYGLLRGLNGDVLATNAFGVLWIGAVVFFWVQGLKVAGQLRSATR